MTWKKFSGEPIRQPILDEVSNTIAREYALGNKLKVCIGTDSQVKGGTTEYATVIVFVREGKGGFMYIHQDRRSEEHTSELQSLMRNSYAVFCLKQKTTDYVVKLNTTLN